MVTLNSLRTKYGVIVSVVIILALLAFIISLGPEMGFGNNDPKVGVINGDNIDYSEYLNEYETIKTYSGMTESTEEESNALANATWQSLIGKHLLTPGFSKMGIEVSDAERLAMISGEHLSSVFYNMFADPQTGEYNVESISAYLQQISASPESQAMWSFINSQAALDRVMAKYMGLVKAGVYVNKLEVAEGVTASNESRSGRLVALPYTSIADADVTISDADIQNYYNAHKENYTKLPSRSISYVVFDVEATDSDMLEIEKKAQATGEEFAVAEDVRAFVRKNMGTVAANYVNAAQLAEDEAVLLDGKQYGPVLKANEWVMSRAIDIKMAPDSVDLSHIVLDPTQTALADSLYTALKGGADFAAAAQQHSVYAATAQDGGKLGVMPYSALNPELAEPLATAKRGDVVKVALAGSIQLIKVNRADAAKKHVLVGTINIPVEASSTTRRDVHNVASIFSVDGKGSLDKFNEAASDAAVTPRVATISQGDRSILGLSSSREIIHWAHGAKVGELSEIFTIGDSYIVAMLTGIDESEYTPLAQVSASISQTLTRDKKYEMLKAKLAGSTIDQIASSNGVEVIEFSNVKMNDYGVASLVMEPRVAGAIAHTSQTGAVSAPVKGYTNAVVFVVDDIVKAETQTAEAEKVRLQASHENIASQMSVAALQGLAEIEDLRGQYF